ncbi:uncharacterized protein STEHIDRAFT_160929 [Stereum hirsutum FP-91666 SS1]|uniref:uncharacterized protein n=1 Tax=Stereum hirsutum (strain FP-91666) TaxID=721885 RepID=UPI00044493EB|nr:uncharacterized protein STEHIDRAFT_160929 [Stereum hirsutum FP-91666 SS1]EIM82380.1 hypothetical protein STEHIDRAFT_160929 [Stereum hirsutum FP-91666 SS1]
MKLISTLSVFFTLLASMPTSVFGAAIERNLNVVKRDSNPSQNCVEGEKYVGIYGINGVYSQACAVLAGNCFSAAEAGTTALWSVKSCVAAQTCDPKTAFVAQCRNTAVANATDIPHLDYNIYAGIVGDCAWAEGGCPITQQNYIDFIYGALSDIGSTTWPSSAQDVITYWWTPMLDWTATGTTIPYTNFDDWLHYDAVSD